MHTQLSTTSSPGQTNFVQFSQSLVNIYRRTRSIQETWYLLYFEAERKFLKFCSEELFIYSLPFSNEELETALKFAYQKVESLRYQKKKNSWELERILVRETFVYLGVDFPI